MNPRRRKTETEDSLRGIRSQLRAAINRSDGSVVLTRQQVLRIEEALHQFEDFKATLAATP